MVLRIEEPPSNRLWFGCVCCFAVDRVIELRKVDRFASTPGMVLDIEPVVSKQEIGWSMILKPIESRLREVVCTASSAVWSRLMNSIDC